MKISTLVAKHIAEVVRGNWTDIYLNDVIADITYQEAVMLPAGVSNSVAMLLYHLSFYNNIVMERLNGNNPAINEENGFDIAVNDEEGWLLLKAACLVSFKKLAACVAALPDERLWEPVPSGNDSFYKTLHGIAEHAHYHLGQIVLLKKIIRSTVKNSK